MSKILLNSHKRQKCFKDLSSCILHSFLGSHPNITRSPHSLFLYIGLYLFLRDWRHKRSIVHFATHVVTYGTNSIIIPPLSPNLLFDQLQYMCIWVCNSVTTNCLVSQAVICTAASLFWVESSFSLSCSCLCSCSTGIFLRSG